MDKTTKTLAVRNLGDLVGADGQTPAARLVSASSNLLSILEKQLPSAGEFCASKISEVSMQRSLPRVRNRLLSKPAKLDSYPTLSLLASRDSHRE
jgi:hypothetical protein